MGPLAHAATAAVLVIAVAVVAYGTQAPFLGVAEFQPSSRAIESPPSTGADAPGSSGRGSRRSTTTTQRSSGSASTSPDGSEAGPPTTVAARVRQCYGEPPQQLPDSRSPLCVATKFEGDNGGSTHRGVTSTDVRIAWVGYSADKNRERAVKAVFDYFNQRFEFYGRRLVPVFVSSGGYGSGAAGQRAIGAGIASNNVFAALEPSADTIFTPGLYSELARNEVLGVAMGWYSTLGERDVFDAMHPYVWTVNPSIDDRQRNMADFICRSLAGKPASHAGPNLAGKTRKFGIIRGGETRLPQANSLIAGLQACGIEPVVAEWMNSRDRSAGLTTALTKMKDAGVTTLTCMCADGRNSSVVSSVSRVIPDKPEWLVLSDDGAWDEWLMQAWVGPEYRGHAFGPLPYGRVTPRQQQYWWRAARESDPELDIPSQSWEGAYAQATYEELLVIAAGVQAAGPTLTPDTFAQGLMSTQFPNTKAGQAPDWLPAAGFGPGDHSLVDDYALAWWSAEAEPFGPWTEAGKGSWCYLGQGARFSVGTFPTDADKRLFNPDEPCR